MKSKKLVFESIGDQIQESDLVANVETDARVLHLIKSQTRFLQKRSWINACCFRLSVGQSRRRPNDTRKPHHPFARTANDFALPRR